MLGLEKEIWESLDILNFGPRQPSEIEFRECKEETETDSWVALIFRGWEEGRPATETEMG